MPINIVSPKVKWATKSFCLYKLPGTGEIYSTLFIEGRRDCDSAFDEDT